MQFRIGNDKFGEIYHLMAVAWLLKATNKKIAIKFANRHIGEEFFDFLGIKRSKFKAKAKVQRLPATANVILEQFYGGCLEKLAARIRGAGKTGKRFFPFPHLADENAKLLIWQRGKEYESNRNCNRQLIKQLVDTCTRHNTIPVILGGPIYGIPGAKELGEFYENAFFESNKLAKQLWFLDQLFRSYGAIASVGMMSGAMDGCAMVFGHKTIYLASHRDATPRMQKVSIAVPNLIWQQVEYEGAFRMLTQAQLQQLENLLWTSLPQERSSGRH